MGYDPLQNKGNVSVADYRYYITSLRVDGENVYKKEETDIFSMIAPILIGLFGNVILYKFLMAVMGKGRWF